MILVSFKNVCFRCFNLRGISVFRLIGKVKRNLVIIEGVRRVQSGHMLCKQLNALFKRHHDKNDLLKSFNFMQFGIATSYHQYLQSLSEKLKVDPKKFWSFHAIKSKTKRLPAVVTYKDR